MKKFCFYLIGLSFYLSLNSCSSSSSECNQTLEPVGNEFTYQCNRYNTENGRFFISSPRNGVSKCIAEFVNNSYSDFVFNAGDTNIKLASIILVVPEASYVSREIPTGEYRLRNLASGEFYSSFDISGSQIAYNSTAQLSSGGLILFYPTEEYDDFNDTVLNLSKSGNIYTIEYSLSMGSRTIKGKFVGEMQVVNNPN